MPPDTAIRDPDARHDGWATLRRFLPYLWPADNPALRWRIAAALLLVLAAKAVTLALPFFYKRAVDLMTAGPAGDVREQVFTVAARLRLRLCAGRFSGVLFDNLRNIVFERVGQDATRHLAEDVFVRLHRLSAALPPRAPHRRGHQGDRARHQEHRHDALFPAVQHRADRDRADRGHGDLLHQLRHGDWCSRPRWRWSPISSSRAWITEWRTACAKR